MSDNFGDIDVMRDVPEDLEGFRCAIKMRYDRQFRSSGGFGIAFLAVCSRSGWVEVDVLLVGLNYAVGNGMIWQSFSVLRSPEGRNRDRLRVVE